MSQLSTVNNLPQSKGDVCGNNQIDLRSDFYTGWENLFLRINSLKSLSEEERLKIKQSIDSSSSEDLTLARSMLDINKHKALIDIIVKNTKIPEGIRSSNISEYISITYQVISKLNYDELLVKVKERGILEEHVKKAEYQDKLIEKENFKKLMNSFDLCRKTKNMKILSMEYIIKTLVILFSVNNCSQKQLLKYANKS